METIKVGMRNIANSINANFNELIQETTTTITTVFSIQMTLKRTGDTVEALLARTTVTGSGGHEQTQSGTTIPYGFRPKQRQYLPIFFNNTSNIITAVLRIDENGITYVTCPSFSNSQISQGSISWKTSDPFPS